MLVQQVKSSLLTLRVFVRFDVTIFAARLAEMLPFLSCLQVLSYDFVFGSSVEVMRNYLYDCLSFSYGTTFSLHTCADDQVPAVQAEIPQRLVDVYKVLVIDDTLHSLMMPSSMFPECLVFLRVPEVGAINNDDISVRADLWKVRGE